MSDLDALTALLEDHEVQCGVFYGEPIFVGCACGWADAHGRWAAHVAQVLTDAGYGERKGTPPGSVSTGGA